MMVKYVDEYLGIIIGGIIGFLSAFLSTLLIDYFRSRRELKKWKLESTTNFLGDFMTHSHLSSVLPTKFSLL